MSGKEIARAFLPNRTVSGGTVRLLVGTEAALAILFWAYSPLSVLPRPL